MSKTEFRASQQNEIEISETEQKLTMSQFLLCFSDEPSGTWVRATVVEHYNLYSLDSRSKKICSIFNMAARREDLPSRRLSLLEEIKDLIETHNSKQNGSENSRETAQRVSRPSQLVTRHRRVTNRSWCKIFVPFSHHFLPALLLVGGHRRRSYGAIFK